MKLDRQLIEAIVATLAVAAIVLLGTYARISIGAEIPRDAYRHRADLTRAAHAVWGLDAPVATFAAQIHQESRWRANAMSPKGASGVAQFMPATAEWIGGAYSALGPGDAKNPTWAMRALVTYDKALHDRANAATPCDRMWMALWGYNGGEAWVRRDQALAAKHGANPRSASAVASYNAGRNAAAFTENRNYPRLIVINFQPRYVAAGFGSGVCA